MAHGIAAALKDGNASSLLVVHEAVGSQEDGMMECGKIMENGTGVVIGE